MKEFEHEIALKELNLSYDILPGSIKGKINQFKQSQGKIFADPNTVDKNKEIQLHAYSAVIAEDIQDFYEKDFEDENQTQNINNMLKDDQLKRAQAVGLTETATMQEVEAKEKAIADKAASDKAATDKAAADKAAADKAAADKAAAEKTAGTGTPDPDKAKADADKAAADKAAAEKQAKEDFFDDFTF